MAEAPSFEDYLVAVANAKRAHPDWRAGQTYFNLLHTMRPDISDGDDPIRTSQYDCFYVDDLIPSFLTEVYARW